VERFMGDAELLRECVRVFLGSCPRHLATIRAAVANVDSQALHHAAHALKGTVALFCGEAAFQAALRLETMGREDNLSGADEAFAILEAALERLQLALTDLTGL
jgi:HPt (histidine-containing phosphotransfer) domain-containing protein